MKNLIAESVRFKSEDGLSLSGFLFLPNQSNDTVIISIHGPQGALNREREQKFAFYCTQSGISYFTFNNRSSAILERFNKIGSDGVVSRVLYGSANDNLYEGLFDIRGSINAMRQKGYQKIVLLGHSLSCAKILHYLDVYGNCDVEAICLLSPADLYNYQKDKLGAEYQKLLEYAKENIDKLELINNGSLEITPKTFCEYADEKSITRYTNYKSDFSNEWKNIPYNIFISFVGINEVVTISPKSIFNVLKNKFLNYNIITKFYKNARHSYGRNGAEVIVDIVSFIKDMSKTKK